MVSENKHPENNDFYRAILDSIPSPVLVVEEDVRIVDMNEAASRMLESGVELVGGLRAGEVLHCLHSTEVAQGCGRSPHCKDCVIRNSVNHSLSGARIVREKMRMQLIAEGGTRSVYLLVTTAPFQYGERSLVLIILEDISEIMEIRDLLPICSWCKRIRDDESYWKSLESYLEKQLDVRLTHGICPECARKVRSDLSQI